MSNNSQPAQRQHFIPLRKSELVELLAEETCAADERQPFRKLCEIVSSTFHFEYHHSLELLKDQYAPFDPDADTLPSASGGDSERVDALFTHLVALFGQANYHRLNQEQIEEALAATNDWGMNLDVDFDLFERLEVFSRGETVLHKTRRRLANYLQPQLFDVPAYQRLAVVFRLKSVEKMNLPPGSPAVFLKLFKNIPKMDLELLLPGTQLRMTLVDRVRIFLPTLTGLSITAAKIVKGAIVLTFAGIYGLLAFLGLVAGTIGYGVKSFFGYQRTKDKYHLNLTRNLYFQNLDNNAGVLYRLIDEVEEQEFRETILAYALLRRHASDHGWNESEIDRQAEAFLKQSRNLQVDFEIKDALQKLLRLGLVSQHEGNRYVAASLEEALTRLDKAWDGFFQTGRESSSSDYSLR